MKDQMLMIDAMARLIVSVPLLLSPRYYVGALGLPKSQGAFWPRTLAVILISIAAGVVLEVKYPAVNGVGLGALCVLNTATALTLLTALVVGGLEIPQRGRLILWLCVLLLVALALFELAWI